MKRNILWVEMTKKMKAREEYLEEFYATHTCIGKYPNTQWVKSGNGDEEE